LSPYIANFRNFFFLNKAKLLTTVPGKWTIH